MRKSFPLIPSFLLALIVITAGCVPQAANPTTPVPPTTSPTQPTTPLVIAGPATPSSIPLILAAQKMGNASVQIITNTAQANTSFLRGEINILASGLSVGVDLRKNDAPVQVLNTYVMGLSYLVTYGAPVKSLSELKGQEITLPFEGSPIEEATMFLAKKEGLAWGSDLKPVYSPFDASVVLLKQGKAKAVVLPEPYVTQLEKEPNLFVSLDYFAMWNKVTGTSAGYPQVGTFVNAQWAAQHPQQVAAFNAALAEAIRFTQEHPEEAVAKVKDQFKLPEAVLLRSIQRTQFALLTGEALKSGVAGYYKTIGKTLDEKVYATFYYLPAQ